MKNFRFLHKSQKIRAMCGIGLCIGCILSDETIELLKRRGPDFYQSQEISNILFYSSILSHQGDELQKQELGFCETNILFNLFVKYFIKRVSV